MAFTIHKDTPNSSSSFPSSHPLRDVTNAPRYARKRSRTATKVTKAEKVALDPTEAITSVGRGNVSSIEKVDWMVEIDFVMNNAPVISTIDLHMLASFITHGRGMYESHVFTSTSDDFSSFRRTGFQIDRLRSIHTHPTKPPPPLERVVGPLCQKYLAQWNVRKEMGTQGLLPHTFGIVGPCSEMWRVEAEGALKAKADVELVTWRTHEAPWVAELKKNHFYNFHVRYLDDGKRSFMQT